MHWTCAGADYLNFKMGYMNMQQEFVFKVDEKIVKDISKSIASEVADRIYYEFLMARYMPEIIAIEKCSVAPLKAEDFKQQLMQKSNNKIGLESL